MTKTTRTSTTATDESFHKHFAAIFGEDRWRNSLYPALASPTRQCILLNGYVAAPVAGITDGDDYEQIPFPDIGSNGQIRCLIPRLPQAQEKDTATSSANLPVPQLAPCWGKHQRLMTHWNLDAASVLAAHLLNVQPDDSVLDMCAAPGGKSIAMAQNVWPHLHEDGATETPRPAVSRSGRLTSNESDAARHKRLTENLKAYLPVELHASKNVVSLRINCAEPMAHRKLSIGGPGYDRVLVDAPCSSERHIIHAHVTAQAGGRTASEIANWRPGSSKRLAKTQVDLLMTALRAAKLGGTVLYATCSIEPGENDGVVEKVLATVDKEMKKGSQWTVKIGFNGGGGHTDLKNHLAREWAEQTKYGWITLPDHPAGGRWGPLFFAMLNKVANDANIRS